MLLFSTATLAGGDVIQKNQLSLERKLNNDVELLGGEVLIREDGLYTKVHTYKHPKKDLEVVLVGDNHGGTDGYPQRIKSYLNQCDLIIHEGFFRGKKNEADLILNRISIEDLSNLSKIEPTSAFMFAMKIFFTKFDKLEKIVNTGRGNVIDKDIAKKSIPIDYAAEEEDAEKVMSNFQEKIDNIDNEKKLMLTEYLIDKIKRIDSKKFELREFGEVYFKLYQDRQVADLFIASSLVKDRDQYLFKELQKIIGYRSDLKKIGIFYGAGHISGLRELLENADYKHIKEEEVLAMEFN